MEDEVITQVFQSPLLIDYLNVKENILLPLTLQGKKEKEEEESVKEALSRVNLSGFEEDAKDTLGWREHACVYCKSLGPKKHGPSFR